jgi:hypothetical protein
MRQVYICGCKTYVLIKRNNGIDLVCSVHKSNKYCTMYMNKATAVYYTVFLIHNVLNCIRQHSLTLLLHAATSVL